MSKAFNEQRRYPRVNVDLFADWGWGPECEYYDKVTSLSQGGCFLATRRELRTGDEIFIKLAAEIAGTLKLNGAIRYQLRVMESAPPRGAGVAFLSVSSEEVRKLAAVVDTYRLAADSRAWTLIS